MFSSLADKISFIEAYTLEPSRHFALINTSESERFDLHWNLGVEGSEWCLESSVWNDESCDEVSLHLSSEELVEALEDNGVCLRDFEKQLDSYLLSYGAHILEAIKSLESLYGSPALSQVQEALPSLSNEIFDLLEEATSKPQPENPPRTLESGSSLEQNLWDGYDLSTLQVAAALRPSLQKGYKRRS